MSEQPKENIITQVAAAAAGQLPATGVPRHRRRATESSDPGPQTQDSFATPDAPEADLEPSIFGGTNPRAASDPVPEDVATAPNFTDSLTDPLMSMEEPLGVADLLIKPVNVNLTRIILSTPFLVILMLFTLAAAVRFIQTGVQAEASARATIGFSNYTKLDEVAQEELQNEIARNLRTTTLRMAAWKIVQKNSPELRAGFLNSGLTLHRLESITWLPNGNMTLTVQTEDPAGDVVRLAAFCDAFYAVAQERNAKRDQNIRDLTAGEQKQIRLFGDDTLLKQQIDGLTPEAEHYIEFKQALQATQRYVVLADENNPLRAIAMQKLAGLSQQVDSTRRFSVQRDGVLARRVELQKQVDGLRASLAQLRRAIDTFSYPKPLDPKTIRVVDTRPRRNAIIRNTCIGIGLFFASIITLVHYAELRRKGEANTIRRQPAGSPTPTPNTPTA